MAKLLQLYELASIKVIIRIKYLKFVFVYLILVL